MGFPARRAWRWRLLGEIGLRHCLGAGGDRLDDVLIAGAAAEIAFELLANDLFGEIVTLAVNHVDRGHDHARRAKAALQAVVLAEGLLHRMQRRPIRREPFDGLHLMAVGHHRERGAGFDRLAVEMHDAGAALRGVAPDMGPGQTQILPQELHQQRAGIDVGGYGISVYDQGDFGHQHSLLPLPRETRGHRCRIARQRRLKISQNPSYGPSRYRATSPVTLSDRSNPVRPWRNS